MARTRKIALTVSVAFLTVAAGAFAPTATAKPTKPTDYLVLLKGTSVDSTARSAIMKAGGKVTEENAKVGYVYVSTTNAAFAETLNASGAVAGTAKERVVGTAPRERRASSDEVEKLTKERAATKGQAGVSVNAKAKAAATTPEPLANLQWDMRQIGATSAGSYAENPGSKGVRVGIIDTGIDGNHPDIAANFDQTLSRNFTVDRTDIDGPCEVVPSCIDPVDVDDDGHGTHVASTIGSPINGLGVAGVAPNVTLINIRAGQDSGYFFLKATLDALTYAGDIGVDVVNMSYYVDPWLYNCVDNPADTFAEQLEQRIIRSATQRALNYARGHGVLPVAAMGNEATDLNDPTFDDSSPDYPANAAKDRTVDNSCISVPTESKGVVAVTSTGPSTRKAYYSNWGTEQADVAAPGGDAYDSPTNTLNVPSLILAAYPESLAKLNGDLNADGTPNTPFVVRSCNQASPQVCGYFQYLQGTSMASPHAAGVAALVVSRNGVADGTRGLKLNPNATQSGLYQSAQPTRCPQPRTYHYTRITANGTVQADHRCEGPIAKNGFYGRGIVNAYAAVAGTDRS